MAYVGEMLRHGLCYRDLTHSYAKAAHHFKGIGISAVGGAESWHRDADDITPVIAKTVECTRGDHQRESRVEAARYTDDRPTAADGGQTLSQGRNKDMLHFLAGI